MGELLYRPHALREEKGPEFCSLGSRGLTHLLGHMAAGPTKIESSP